MEKDLKTVLSECGFGFKKQLGQNFITDKNLLKAIVALSGATAEDNVVEIGCGAGTLTREIAAAVKRVVAYEVDKALAPVLDITLADCGNAEVIFGDFLKVDIAEMERGLGDYRVIANLPYYATTPLIMKLVEQSEKCRSLTVMVQEEVAERLCAAAGTPEYGAITAMLALRTERRIVKRVPRAMFFPRPNVDSAVVNIVFGKPLAVKDKLVYKKTVHAAFLSRRKTLENNLVNAFGFTRDTARAALNSCGIDIKARGETLSPEQFAALADVIADVYYT